MCSPDQHPMYTSHPSRLYQKLLFIPDHASSIAVTQLPKPGWLHTKHTKSQKPHPALIKRNLPRSPMFRCHHCTLQSHQCRSPQAHSPQSKRRLQLQGYRSHHLLAKVQPDHLQGWDLAGPRSFPRLWARSPAQCPRTCCQCRHQCRRPTGAAAAGPVAVCILGNCAVTAARQAMPAVAAARTHADTAQ
jgi:hypothetical protein